MKYLQIGDVKIPTEFMMIESHNDIMLKNNHYVIDFASNTHLISIIKCNGKKYDGFLTLGFFVDFCNKYKEFSLESYNKLKAFL